MAAIVVPLVDAITFSVQAAIYAIAFVVQVPVHAYVTR